MYIFEVKFKSDVPGAVPGGCAGWQCDDATFLPLVKLWGGGFKREKFERV